MLKHPTLSLEDEEGSRLELLLVSGQSTRGILKLEGAIWKFGVSKQLYYFKDIDHRKCMSPN